MVPPLLERVLPAPELTEALADVGSAPSPAASDSCILAMRGISKRWRTDEPPVLDGLELGLEPGTLTWVGGPNGAGKTTMLRIAAGLIEAQRGRVEVWGFTARENRRRYQQLVSFLPAGDRGLYARLTVRRQLEFCACIAMLAPALARSAVANAIRDFALGDLAPRRVDRISMGQRQRLRLAITFLGAPELVLLDEPLTSLDAAGAGLLQGAIAETLARSGAVLWCSPQTELPEAHFDSRWVLERGRLVSA
jgi:ABC-type multidrug transport system ATPase subunit